jgi:hypothetical protein
MKFASGVLPPILPLAQRVGYGRTLSIVVIVIADCALGSNGRREEFVNRIKYLGPPKHF